MSTQLRAKVRRSRIIGNWIATVYLNDRPTESRLCLSWPEAMQQAYADLANLDRQLMDEVHASRATRREQKCAECDETVAPGKAHWKLNEEGCMILPADQIDPDTAEATYTMEPTA